MNVLLGVTGSVAAKLTSKMVRTFLDRGDDVKTIMTASAEKISTYRDYSDKDEWRDYDVNEEVLHIKLAKWADAFLIAPCSANTMAKITYGFCDNLLTSTVRAYPLNKTLLIAPAMNTVMYENPTYKEHCVALSRRGYYIVPPVAKELYCGDTGIGAMAPIDDIVKRLDI